MTGLTQRPLQVTGGMSEPAWNQPRLISASTLPERGDELVDESAKGTVAHHQKHIALSRVLRHSADDRFDVGVPIGRNAARGEVVEQAVDVQLFTRRNLVRLLRH